MRPLSSGRTATRSSVKREIEEGPYRQPSGSLDALPSSGAQEGLSPLRAPKRKKIDESHASALPTRSTEGPAVSHKALLAELKERRVSCGFPHEEYRLRRSHVSDRDIMVENEASVSLRHWREREALLRPLSMSEDGSPRSIYSRMWSLAGTDGGTVSPQMRTVLVEWLWQVSTHEFTFEPETFFYAVDYLDRCLSISRVSRSQLQLLGISCLWLASKFEEVHPPLASELLEMTGNTYSISELMKMESRVLNLLNFDTSPPLALRFLEYYETVLSVKDPSIYLLARHLLEVSTLNSAEWRPLSLTSWKDALQCPPPPPSASAPQAKRKNRQPHTNKAMVLFPPLPSSTAAMRSSTAALAVSAAYKAGTKTTFFGPAASRAQETAAAAAAAVGSAANMPLPRSLPRSLPLSRPVTAAASYGFLPPSYAHLSSSRCTTPDLCAETSSPRCAPDPPTPSPGHIIIIDLVSDSDDSSVPDVEVIPTPNLEREVRTQAHLQAEAEARAMSLLAAAPPSQVGAAALFAALTIRARATAAKAAASSSCLSPSPSPPQWGRGGAVAEDVDQLLTLAAEAACDPARLLCLSQALRHLLAVLGTRDETCPCPMVRQYEKKGARLNAPRRVAHRTAKQ